jgi:hypothetical protein
MDIERRVSKGKTMNTTVLKKVRQMFNNPYAPPNYNRAYQRKWVRQVRNLGDKWLLAKSVRRCTIS